MSETEPEKKGWFARLRSKVAPTVEPPKPAEPEVAQPEPVEPAVATEPELPAAPPPIEAVPEPEPVPVEAVAEKEPEPEKPETEKKGWLSRLREGLSKSTRKVAESITGLFTKRAGEPVAHLFSIVPIFSAERFALLNVLVECCVDRVRDVISRSDKALHAVGHLGGDVAGVFCRAVRRRAQIARITACR